MKAISKYCTASGKNEILTKRENSINTLQVKGKIAIIFLYFFCISFHAFSQNIKEEIAKAVAGAVLGEGISKYQENELKKFASRDGAIIAIIPATTRSWGTSQEGIFVVTKSNVYFSASELISLVGTIVMPISGIRHKQSTFESLFGFYKRDAVEVTYNGETRLFIFHEEKGEWEKFKKAIEKAIEMKHR
jgi:hypothetical protein